MDETPEPDADWRTSKPRRQIAIVAARMIFDRSEANVFQARLKAARSICRGWVRTVDLPEPSEIREQLQLLLRTKNRADSAADSQPSGAEQSTGGTDESQSAGFYSRCEIAESQWESLENGSQGSNEELPLDRFNVYRSLLLPLEHVVQNPEYHPEGDALYHSLQVFELGYRQLPYDEEFLLAALLHEIGLAIEPRDPHKAALAALQGYVTERTAWLIENHLLVHQLRAGPLGHRQERRLRANDSYRELLVLGECDRQGRVPGGDAPELEEALELIHQLNGEG